MGDMEMSVETIRRLVDSDSDGPIEAHCRPAIRWLLEDRKRLDYEFCCLLLDAEKMGLGGVATERARQVLGLS